MALDDPSFNYGAYTVGIICALGLEMNAVRHVLDQEHRSLPVNSQDSTIYVLGELSDHNVVIACLPGNQGKSASAIAATNMARTFPSIKYRVLLGIGGGVPSARKDIRLGDVVVSMATDVHGGVIQYDLGKDTETGFVRKGLTSPPPSVLRGAVYKMQNDHAYRLSQKGDFAEPTVYAYPRPCEEDILFEATYPHQSPQSSCGGCDTKMTVQRPLRADDLPRIFYGLIAFGDRVVKSGVKRDVIVAEINDDVLCFEMEAAGFMHEFPAVVIRGISDYADSHKNDTWQPYAAASAAVCAKELLSHLEPERSAGDVLSTRLPPGSSEMLHQFLADICETDPQNEMTRIQQSKGTLIADCNSWIIESSELQTWQTSNEAQLLWMKGGPGKGKTMATISLVDFYTHQIGDRNDVCYFFCQNSIPHLNNSVSILRALVWKLLWKNNGLSKYIPDEYKCKKDHGREVFESPNAFAMLTRMLSQILRDEHLGKVFVLIDALDECDNGMEPFLEWTSHQTTDFSSKAKWLISSRHTPHIEQFLRPRGHKICLDLDSSECHVLKSVDYFIESRTDQLADRKGLSPEQQKEIGNILRAKSGSTILWVALACQRLQAINSRRKMKTELEKLPSGLGPLYDRMLEQLEALGDEDDKDLCQRILRTVITAFRPLSIGELGAVAALPVDNLDDVLELVGLCSSFLLVRGGYVYIVHQSARDYFCDGMGQRLFANGVVNEHKVVLQRLLGIMDSRLSRNIYALDHPGSLIEEIVCPQPDPLALLSYSTTNWVAHLAHYVSHSPIDSHIRTGFHDGGKIDSFLRKRLLHWLEALSLMGSLASSLQMIRSLQNLIKVRTRHFQAKLESFANNFLYRAPSSENLAEMIQDSYQFVLYNKACIEAAPLQVYYSSLMFSPQRSIVKGLFRHEMPQWLVNPQMLEEHWSPCLHVLEGHTAPVLSVVFSPDNQLIVSGSDDGTIRIWDAESGTTVRCLEGHTGPVMDVVVSPDGRWIGSASVDCTVRLWNLRTGALVMGSHTHAYKSALTFSMDSQDIIFLSAHRVIQIWNIDGKAFKHAYQLHPSLAGPTALSPHGRWVASVDDGGIIRIGDINTGTMQISFKPEDAVTSILFLSGDSEVASVAQGAGVVHVWNIITGSIQCSYQGDTGRILSTGFLSNGKVVVISAYETVKLRNMKNDEILQTFLGHNDLIQTVDISSDGRRIVSGSEDNTLRVWNADPSHFRPTASRPIGDVESLVLSPDSRVVASAWSDSQVRLWCMETGSLLHTFGDIDQEMDMAFSSDSRYLATLEADEFVRVWECVSGLAICTFHSCADSLSNGLYAKGIPFYNKHTKKFSTARQEEAEGDTMLELYHQWIEYLGKKVLWLPIIYLPGEIVTRNSQFIIGCYTGRLLILDLTRVSEMDCEGY